MNETTEPIEPTRPRNPNILTWSQMKKQCDDEEAQLRQDIDNGKMWGNWKYNPTKPPSIDHTTGKYEITIDRINSDEKLGAWLLHLAEKNWITADDLGQLVTFTSTISKEFITHE